MKAPSTAALVTIAVLALMLFSFAGGIEFANSRHEAAAARSFDSQAKWVAQVDEAEHAYRARIHELEAACRK